MGEELKTKKPPMSEGFPKETTDEKEEFFPKSEMWELPPFSITLRSLGS
jgi:hypothetical protein